MIFNENQVMDEWNHNGVEKWKEGFFADDKGVLKAAVMKDDKTKYGKMHSTEGFSDWKSFFPMVKNNGTDWDRENFAYFYPIKPREDAEMGDEIKKGRYEPNVGDIFVLDGKNVVVMKNRGCFACVRDCTIRDRIASHCSGLYRSDRQSVQYVEIKKGSVKIEEKDTGAEQGRYKIDLSWLRGKAREVMSEAIQKKAFEKGYGWRNGSNELSRSVSYCYSPYLFIKSETKEITRNSNSYTFKGPSFSEISVNKALKGEYENSSTKRENTKPKMYKFYKGQRVQFKSWNEMTDEYGVDRDGDINCFGNFTRNMKHLCGTYATIKNFNDMENRIYLKDFTSKCNIDWTYSTNMLKPASTKER